MEITAIKVIVLFILPSLSFFYIIIPLFQPIEDMKIIRAFPLGTLKLAEVAGY
jgi:hypothetical protein